MIETWIYLQVNMWLMLIFSNYLSFKTKLDKLLVFTPWIISVVLVILDWFL
jgi:hypothetical protein